MRAGKTIIRDGEHGDFFGFLISNELNFPFMGSDIFFHGLSMGETCEVKIDIGKELVIRLVDVSNTDEEGYKYVTFEVNSTRSAVRIKDQDATNLSAVNVIAYADENDKTEIGANIPGNILKVLVKEGEEVEENQPIAIIEAMKMETNILSSMEGKVSKIYVNEGQQVKSGELIAKLEEL